MTFWPSIAIAATVLGAVVFTNSLGLIALAGAIVLAIGDWAKLAERFEAMAAEPIFHMAFGNIAVPSRTPEHDELLRALAALCRGMVTLSVPPVGAVLTLPCGSCFDGKCSTGLCVSPETRGVLSLIRARRIHRR